MDHDCTVISVVRNEMLRLPYFLTHYRALGCERFIIIDNGSTDGSGDFLRAQPDVVHCVTNESYRDGSFGVNWLNRKANELCDGKWIVCADADELLIWPQCQTESIHQLTARLDEGGFAGVFTIMLDMYSDRPFGEIRYKSGEPFVNYCPFFDRGPSQFARIDQSPYQTIYGGVRARAYHH